MILYKYSFKKTVYCTVFYIANLLLLGLILLPAVSANITVWWLDNLLNLQLQWSIVALLLQFLNHFYFKIYPWPITLAYFSLVTYNLIPLYIKPHTAKEIMKKTAYSEINVAQLNLQYDNPNLKQLLPTLGNIDFDLLVIQEASDQQYQLINQLGQYYPFNFGISKNEATPSGMAIFSRWPIIEKHNHNLGAQRGHLLEVLLQHDRLNSPIQLYALHPVSPRTKKLWQTRNSSLKEMARMIASSPFTHKIVVGDFNSSPWSAEFKNFQKNTQLKSSADGFGYISSWSYSDNPVLSLISSAYIDHQLVSKNVSVLNKNSTPISGSDHQLILTQLQITH